MKVVLLSPSTSIHTIQWAKYLIQQGVDIHVVSQHAISEDWPKDIPVTLLPYRGFLGYFLNIFALKKILIEIQPDLLNAHYATGYGTTARLANFHPYVLSVWGSDVFEFPYRSPFHKKLLQQNINCADVIASTSLSMAKQTQQFVDAHKKIEITPFGVDLDKFNPSCFDKNTNAQTICIGTVKTLKHVYGIDILLKALSIVFSDIKNEFPEVSNQLNFRIVGGGTDMDELKKLAVELGIDHLTHFTGSVSHEDVPSELNRLDIYVALSRQESFGVAVVEAQAMGIPVVVSNVGGLPEVLQNGKTGFIVDSENPQKAANAIKKLILDTELRQTMSIEARQFVNANFSWQTCAKKMSDIYQNTLNFLK
ncbi:glycosyltransferase [Acinetobacter johnsonii]|uniref:Glycosyltransferase n=1 Tax=Acinetobacter johnsonii TaxID=40214 RepID=A0AA42MQU3_ACIJO|nr:glycosyltransferase [Acinetobacter johnsonii]MDH0967794.1 glycosyltransferase [Acinetobacter johnsonii]